MINSDLELLIAFHNAFIFPHFQFLQVGDPKIGGTPSFLGRHCAIRYFLMVQDIESIKDNRWKENNEFKDFNQSVNALDESERALQNKKITLFTQYISNSIEKPFSQ